MDRLIIGTKTRSNACLKKLEISCHKMKGDKAQHPEAKDNQEGEKQLTL